MDGNLMNGVLGDERRARWQQRGEPSAKWSRRSPREFVSKLASCC